MSKIEATGEVKRFSPCCSQWFLPLYIMYPPTPAHSVTLTHMLRLGTWGQSEKTPKLPSDELLHLIEELCHCLNIPNSDTRKKRERRRKSGRVERVKKREAVWKPEADRNKKKEWVYRSWADERKRIYLHSENPPVSQEYSVYECVCECRKMLCRCYSKWNIQYLPVFKASCQFAVIDWQRDKNQLDMIWWLYKRINDRLMEW